MGFKDIGSRIIRENVLHSVLLELTYRCNLNCFFCYNDLDFKGDPLAAEDYLRLLDDLAGMQVMFLTLSGGEPLASPAFWPVGRRAHELGFIVRVKSNGHAVRGKVARRLKEEIDPYSVEVSLHGSRAETHDRQTRIPGSFERLVENLAGMKAVGLRVELNSTVTCWNEDEIEDMCTLADDLDIFIRFDPAVTPRDNGERDTLAVSASPAGVERLFRTLDARQAKRIEEGRATIQELGRHSDTAIPTPPGKNCGAGANTVLVDPFGNVYPCVEWRRGVGNLHQSSIRDIWGGSRELTRVRELNEEAARTYTDGMGFCMGLAEELTGDPLATYASRETTSQALVAARGKVRLPVLT